MPQFDNFQASISVDGVDLPEYGVAIDEKKKVVTCWVPSEVGKSFALNWKLLQCVPHYVSGRLLLDGQYVGYTTTRENLCRPVSHSCVRTSPTTKQGFVFSSLDLTDDDDDDDFRDLANLKELGNIKVEFCHCKRSKAKVLFKPKRFDEESKVHERAKKGMAQRVKLGEPISVKPRRDVSSLYTVTNVVVLWTLIFKYRSIEILRANGIVPSDPVPTILGKRANDEDTDVMDVNEEAEKRVKQLRKELQALEDQLAKKSSGSGSRSHKRIKTESPFVSGEVIDLT